MARMIGPVTGGSRGWAFAAPAVDLAELGYQQEEYFLEGKATRYGKAPGTELGWDGGWRVEPVGTSAFKTRMVVVRPVDPAAFSGTVIVGWNDVSAGYENFGGGDSPELFEGGFAYAAVSTQRVGVHGHPDNPQGLRAWDPERYGSLSIPSDDIVTIFSARTVANGYPSKWNGPSSRAGYSTSTGWGVTGSPTLTSRRRTTFARPMREGTLSRTPE